jgi:hypothetical protein
VWNRKGVAEPIGISSYRGAAADNRSAALEFVDREVHTLSEKHPKCIFHALMLDESFQVAVLAPGELKE